MNEKIASKENNLVVEKNGALDCWDVQILRNESKQTAKSNKNNNNI